MTSTSTSPQPEVRARAVIDAYNAHDAAGVVEHMAEDAVYVNLGLRQRLEGRAAIREYIAGVATTFSSDYRFSLGAVIGDEDLFAAEWTMSGTHDGTDPATGLPSTGRPFQIPGVTLVRSRAGRAVEWKVYWNLADLLQQVGLMSASGSATVAS